MSKLIVSLVLSLSSMVSASEKVHSIPECGKGHVEVFSVVNALEFPTSTVLLSRDVVAGIKGYLSNGLTPALCNDNGRIVFSVR